jgi:hypothetical protein
MMSIVEMSLLIQTRAQSLRAMSVRRSTVPGEVCSDDAENLLGEAIRQIPVVYGQDASNAHCVVRLVLTSADQGVMFVADRLNPVFRDGNEVFFEDKWLGLGVYQREFDEG